LLWLITFQQEIQGKSTTDSKDLDLNLVFNENFNLAVRPLARNMSQNGQKPTSLITSLTKSPKPQNFFHCRLEDLPNLLRAWKDLSHNR